MLKSLPPAGNPISLTSVGEPEKVFESVFGDRTVFLYGSGTMALAASLIAVKKHRGVKHPEVLLPAYACPDLVSAVLYAGFKPVLVDLEPDTPWMDLEQLQQKIGPNTIAVVAAHFLGIPERIADIRRAFEGSDIAVIEDSAQLFPVDPIPGVWEGDLVILSFGRGKPVSILGGGAVLCKQEFLEEQLPISSEVKLKIDNLTLVQPSIIYKVKVHLYNTLLKSWAYGALKLFPFLHLGETMYKPLQKIYSFDQSRIGVLAANIAAYRSRKRVQQDILSSMFADIFCEKITDLANILPGVLKVPLLRYPVLVKEATLRSRLISALSMQGLGCSTMYPQHLPNINGLKDIFREQGDFPQAMLFAQRLLTLPCHSGVKESEIQSIKEIISRLCEIK